VSLITAKDTRVATALGLLFVIGSVIMTVKEMYWFLLIPFVGLFIYLALFRLDKLLLSIAFLAPLSVNVEIPKLGFALFLPTEPLMILVLALFVIKNLFEGGMDLRLFRHPITLLILLQLAWILFTSVTSTMPMVSFKFLVARLWFLTSFYFLGVELFKSEKNIRSFLWLAIFGMTAVIIYTVVRHYLHNFEEQPAHWVMSPFFKDHTSYGAILSMLFPVLLGMTIVNRGSAQLKYLQVVLVLIFLVGIILSYTRAAWLSLIAAGGVYLAIYLRINYKVILSVALTVFGLLFAFQDQIIMKLEKNNQDSSGDFTEHVQSMTNISTDASNLERLNRWSAAFRMFADKPIVGFGPGTYQFQYAPYQHPNEKTIISTNNADMGNAHSEYFGPLSEQGLLGSLLVLAIVIASIASGVYTYYRLPEGQLKVIVLCVTLGLVTYWTHGFLNNFLDTDKASVLVWGFTAIIVVAQTFFVPESSSTTNSES